MKKIRAAGTVFFSDPFAVAIVVLFRVVWLLAAQALDFVFEHSVVW